MDSKSYYRDLIESFLYTLIIVLICSAINLFSEPCFSVLTGANLALAIIAVPCCLVYYSANNKNSRFFIYLLIYSSICIQCILNYYLSICSIHMPDLVFTFLYRTILISLLLYTESSFVKFCMKYPKITYVISIIIDLLSIFFNNYINNYLSVDIYINALFYLIAAISYIIIIKLTIETLRKRNSILTIFTISTIILRIRLCILYIFNLFNIPAVYIAEDSVFFFFALLIILVGLFVKAKQIILINKGLNKDVETISASVKEIKELEKMRSYFFANLSHELKTPVNLISTALQLLEYNSKINDDLLLESYYKYEKTLKQNTYRMIRLTNNFVDISKIDAGFLKLHFKNYNIVQLVETITMSVLFYVEMKNINIVFDTTHEEIYIKCDSDAIERIVLNLLSNALKFTKEQGNILVDVSTDSEYVYIKVKDDGYGIDENIKDHIFDMYVQGDKSLNRKKEGSGIGLSLVRSLVKLHDGDVFLSDTHIGTEIIVKIPNIKIQENELVDTTNSSRELIEKIDIEFSDIYDLN